MTAFRDALLAVPTATSILAGVSAALAFAGTRNSEEQRSPAASFVQVNSLYLFVNSLQSFHRYYIILYLQYADIIRVRYFSVLPQATTLIFLVFKNRLFSFRIFQQVVILCRVQRVMTSRACWLYHPRERVNISGKKVVLKNRLLFPLILERVNIILPSHSTVLWRITSINST